MTVEDGAFSGGGDEPDGDYAEEGGDDEVVVMY